MNYITLKDCKNSLFDIALASSPEEVTPHYLTNKRGITRLESILVQIQTNYYKGFFEKASFLFISINRGHLFTNGNKRLALTLLLNFIYINDYKFKGLTEKTYRKWFETNFPQYKISNRKFKRVYGWAMYNMNKAVASDTEYGFEELKSKVNEFIMKTI
ncbi:type II toxin-antitoxin system death-on-curing family toxin [Candidatus Uabimicrobium sp. HlEnr_7]|uniref:type II toxin-antitoxin system death-on-curing family toxin n=1 Tax=Candidatus Uabimicrobium helgolandensis TaxID=3095367 RepID=UPI003558BE00